MKKIGQRLKLATLSTTMVISCLLGVSTAFAQDAYIPAQNKDLIVPYMGNERVVVNGSLAVSRTYDFGYFKLNNNSIKVVWSPSSTSNFKLQVVQTGWLGGETVIATMNLGSTNSTQYFTNMPKGADLHFRVVGSAKGSISAYDYGPN
ncbi:hypothetical protein D3C76_469340 [compost metagenome]